MAAGDTLIDSDGNMILDADGNTMIHDGVTDECCCGGCLCVPAADLATTYRITLSGNFVPQHPCWDGDLCDPSSLSADLSLSFDCADNGNIGSTEFDIEDFSGDTLCIGGVFASRIILVGTSCGWTLDFQLRDSDGLLGGQEIIYSQRTPSSDPVGIYDLDAGASSPYCDGAGPATVTVT